MKKHRPGSFCECGAHAWALATKGYVVLVSSADIDLLNNNVWSTKLTPRNAYAFRSQRDETGKLHNFYLHHSVIRPAEGEEIDHKNRNGMDNTRENLRSASHQSNALNAKKKANATSEFKGVYRKRGRSKWTAAIKMDGAVRYLGNFETEAAAFECVQSAALKEHGSNWSP